MIGTLFSNHTETTILDANALVIDVTRLKERLSLLLDSLHEIHMATKINADLVDTLGLKLTACKKQLGELEYNLVAAVSILTPIEVRFHTEEYQHSLGLPDDDIPF